MTKLKEEQNENTSDNEIADGAETIVKGLDMASAGLKGVGDAVLKPAKYIGKTVKAVVEAIKDPEGEVVKSSLWSSQNLSKGSSLRRGFVVMI